jgi:hypothetical protein
MAEQSKHCVQKTQVPEAVFLPQVRVSPQEVICHLLALRLAQLKAKGAQGLVTLGSHWHSPRLPIPETCITFLMKTLACQGLS